MYIAFKGDGGVQFADPELAYLEKLLQSIDDILSNINLKIENSIDPESDGLCDEGEYFIGLGFCAMQRYLVDVITDTKFKKSEILSIGPRNRNNIPISTIINAAGNYWKHSPEWGLFEKLNRQADNTISQLYTQFSDEIHHWYVLSRYVLSDVLADLSDGKELSLRHCIPYLKEWRYAVHQNLHEK